jgi:hypothetical protein
MSIYLAEETPYFDNERSAEELDNMNEEDREEYLAHLEEA